MGKPRKSKIWTIEKEILEKFVSESSSIAGLLSKIEISHGRCNYDAIKKRMIEEGIDFGHIPLGQNSNKGRSFNNNKIPLKNILVEHSNYNRNSLKKRLIADGLLENKCSKCGISTCWNGENLVLIIDHINGIYNDNRLENLRLLCPNCNSQTSTFAGRNINKEERDKKIQEGLLPRQNKCPICGKPKLKSSTICFQCNNVKDDKKKVKNRPSKEELQQLLEEYNYSEIGRIYEVSGNAIKKWAKTYEIYYKQETKGLKEIICGHCGKLFTSYDHETKFCSMKCKGLSSRKVKDIPSNDKLLQEIELTSCQDVANNYGVSIRTIRRWIHNYSNK